MDRKDKEPRGTTATASKMAANRKQTGGESTSPEQNQNQGGASGSQQQNQQNQQNQGSGGQDLLQQAKQTTNEVVSQVQQQAGTQINRQKDTAASELSTVGNAVRRFGETLNAEGQGPIARFAAQYGEKAADGIDRFARYLREQDPQRLLNDVQNLGRRQPALMIGGAFLLGFAGARIIKSSMEAAGNSTRTTGGQSSRNMGMQGSQNTGAQQPFNTNISGAQQPSPPSNPA